MTITCTKSQYEQYVNAGLWKPLDTPKYHKASVAIVECEVKMRARKTFRNATIQIDGYYTKDQIVIRNNFKNN